MSSSEFLNTSLKGLLIWWHDRYPISPSNVVSMSSNTSKTKSGVLDIYNQQVIAEISHGIPALDVGQIVHAVDSIAGV